MNEVILYLANHIENDELLGRLVHDIATYENSEQSRPTKQLAHQINQVARRFVEGEEERVDLTHVHRDPKLAALTTALKQSSQHDRLEGQPLLAAPRYTTEQA